MAAPPSPMPVPQPARQRAEHAVAAPKPTEPFQIPTAAVSSAAQRQQEAFKPPPALSATERWWWWRLLARRLLGWRRRLLARRLACIRRRLGSVAGPLPPVMMPVLLAPPPLRGRIHTALVAWGACCLSSSPKFLIGYLTGQNFGISSLQVPCQFLASSLPIRFLAVPYQFLQKGSFLNRPKFRDSFLASSLSLSSQFLVSSLLQSPQGTPWNPTETDGSTAAWQFLIDSL